MIYIRSIGRRKSSTNKRNRVGRKKAKFSSGEEDGEEEADIEGEIEADSEGEEEEEEVEKGEGEVQEEIKEKPKVLKLLLYIVWIAIH